MAAITAAVAPTPETEEPPPPPPPPGEGASSFFGPPPAPPIPVSEDMDDPDTPLKAPTEVIVTDEDWDFSEEA